jgi:hypothetical protein
LSHLPQRKEKNCLNCGTEVIGPYCHQCGQENLEPKETVWHLITHFFYDFTHFDGKFFSTLKYLIFKPGFVSSEYMRGRRTSYLHPVRMYIFTSAFFFIIFFWLFHFNKIDINPAALTANDSTTWIRAQEYALKGADTHKDSMEILKGIEDFKTGIKADSSKEKKRNNVRITVDTISYKTVAEYDSVQKSLPEEERDNWLKRMIRKREIHVVESYKGDQNAFWKDVLNNFLHQFPKVFFISLPIFALLLKMLYIRRRQFYYADHLIFTTHLYIVTFIILLLWFCIIKLNNYFPSVAWVFVQAILWLYFLFYVYKAMRNFYKQGRFKTIVKYLLLNFASFIIILILFAIFFSYSVLQM